MIKMLVAVPALNEEATIADVVSRIPDTIAGVDSVDILVVDDGSTDRTAELAIGAGAEVTSHGRNLGLGDAFRSALEHARRGGYRYLVTLDADGQFNPADIPTLAAPVITGKADFTSASRFLCPEYTPEMSRIKKRGNRIVAGIVSRLSGVEIKDATCGFRAYGPNALEMLSSFSRFTYTQEVIIDLAGKGMKIEEVPLRILGERPEGKSRISSNLWRYAFLSLAAMYSSAQGHYPWRFYGRPALLLIVPGFICDLAILLRWLIIGRITPYAGIAIGGLFVITFGILMLLFASVANISTNSRKLIERSIAEDVRRIRREKERSEHHSS
jgi:glycosyltransferase involved in cell wall biosynthesis